MWITYTVLFFKSNKAIAMANLWLQQREQRDATVHELRAIGCNTDGSMKCWKTLLRTPVTQQYVKSHCMVDKMTGAVRTAKPGESNAQLWSRRVHRSSLIWYIALLFVRWLNWKSFANLNSVQSFSFCFYKGCALTFLPSTRLLLVGETVKPWVK